MLVQWNRSYTNGGKNLTNRKVIYIVVYKRGIAETKYTSKIYHLIHTVTNRNTFLRFLN